mgnify:CR=1 FL=1
MLKRLMTLILSGMILSGVAFAEPEDAMQDELPVAETIDAGEVEAVKKPKAKPEAEAKAITVTGKIVSKEVEGKEGKANVRYFLAEDESGNKIALKNKYEVDGEKIDISDYADQEVTISGKGVFKGETVKKIVDISSIE